MRVEIPNTITATIGGLISRGVKAVEVTDGGRLVFTLTDGITVVRVGRLGKLGQKLALLLPPRSSLFGAEGSKRRVQMQIGSMQKFNHGAPPFLPPCSGLSSRRW